MEAKCVCVKLCVCVDANWLKGAVAVGVAYKKRQSQSLYFLFLLAAPLHLILQVILIFGK